jgi:hypothetical protein
MGLSYFDDVVNLELHPLELEIELVVPTLTSFHAVPQEFQTPVFNHRRTDGRDTRITPPPHGFSRESEFNGSTKRGHEERIEAGNEGTGLSMSPLLSDEDRRHGAGWKILDVFIRGVYDVPERGELVICRNNASPKFPFANMTMLIAIQQSPPRIALLHSRPSAPYPSACDRATAPARSQQYRPTRLK